MTQGCGVLPEGSIRYLSVENIIELNRYSIERFTPDEPFGILKPNELESAQQRPSVTKFYEQTVNIFYLTASLVEALVQNHCFANANKRTAWLAGKTFLALNGYDWAVSMEASVDMMVRLATHEITMQQFYLWIEETSVEVVVPIPEAAN